MAETFQFDLVSPERSLASMTVREVVLPGSEGEMTALPDHAPVITALRPGLVVAQGPDGRAEFVVTQGIAEITPTSVSVIAERAYPRADVTRADLELVLKEARAHAEIAAVDEKHGAEKFVTELMHFIETMG